MPRTERVERIEKQPEITIKTAERFNGKLIASGTIDGTWWTATKCHTDPHIQWSVGMPNHHMEIEEAAALSNIVCRHLIRNAETIQSMLPVLEEVKKSTRRRATA